MTIRCPIGTNVLIDYINGNAAPALNRPTFARTLFEVAS